MLFNPNPNIAYYMESAINGPKFAEKSLGSDFNGDINDPKAIAKHLRELADMLEAPAVENKELL